MKYFNLIFFLLLVFAGCSSSHNPGDIVQIDIDKLRGAPSEVKLDGITYTLEAYIWRDFMPDIDTVTNKGLMASIKLKLTDNTPIPSTLKITRLWILNKDYIWMPEPLRITQLTSDVIEIYASEGPLWEAGIKVRVVFEFILNNQKLLLGLENQEVQAVY